MPRGPKGQKRPADVAGNAVHVMKVLTGEIVEEGSPSPSAPRAGRLAAGGAEALSPEQRSEIARKAAASRWSKKVDVPRIGMSGRRQPPGSFPTGYIEITEVRRSR
jgi:hypothetical protein